MNDRGLCVCVRESERERVNVHLSILCGKTLHTNAKMNDTHF